MCASEMRDIEAGKRANISSDLNEEEHTEHRNLVVSLSSPENENSFGI